MRPLNELKSVITAGGSVSIGGEIVQTHGRLEELHAKHLEQLAEVEANKGEGSEQQFVLTQPSEADVAKARALEVRAETAEADAKAQTERAEKAEKVLQPFQTRNGEQFDLIQALTAKEEDLKRLSPTALRAVAKFEKASFKVRDEDAVIVAAVLSARALRTGGGA